MSSQTVTQAVAERDNSPTALIEKYTDHFAAVLPSHVKAETWVRVAQGALRRGRRITDSKSPQFGLFELSVAAANNPGAFLAALLDAARLGLEPGSEQYYLTPRKVKGRLEILGIVGYQGHIELIYRAGAVSSVVAEVVRANDEYRYDRGVDTVPLHRFKPFARTADRGPLIGVYSYAHMKDGAISRVVELNQDDIDRIRKYSQGADGEYSPWVNHEAAMWLKSSVRQLQKWVPTSAEFRMELARAIGEAQRVAAAPTMPAGVEMPQVDFIDGESVDDWPAPATVPDGGDA